MSGEKQVLDGLISIDDINTLYPCTLPDDETTPPPPAINQMPLFSSTEGADNRSPALSIHPNPASHQITLSAKGLNSTNAILILKDITGRVLVNLTFVPNSSGNYSNNIDLNNYPSGIYSLEIIQDNFRLMHKVVKQ